MGRNPVPVEVLAMRGSPLAKSRESLSHATGDCTCPEWLTEVGRAKWEEIYGLLAAVPGLMRPIHTDALAFYCEAFEEFIRARDKLSDDTGMVAVSANGGEYQSAWLGIKNRALARMRQQGALFGMSPVDAMRVAGEGVGADPEADQFPAMMKAQPN